MSDFTQETCATCKHLVRSYYCELLEKKTFEFVQACEKWEGEDAANK